MLIIKKTKFHEHPCRVVLTGGPGGGKTTAADLYRRELGEKVIVVPETASILFSGGFPRSKNQDAIRSLQTAIFHVQTQLEETQAILYPERVLLCDRGTLDGAAYWPSSEADFFSQIGSSIDHELNRYNAVIFFETAAAGGLGIEGGNPSRIESLEEALELDKKLRDIWSRHPNFTLVPHSDSFMKKINYGLMTIENITKQLLNGPK